LRHGGGDQRVSKQPLEGEQAAKEFETCQAINKFNSAVEIRMELYRILNVFKLKICIYHMRKLIYKI